MYGNSLHEKANINCWKRYYVKLNVQTIFTLATYEMYELKINNKYTLIGSY